MGVDIVGGPSWNWAGWQPPSTWACAMAGNQPGPRARASDKLRPTVPESGPLGPGMGLDDAGTTCSLRYKPGFAPSHASGWIFDTRLTTCRRHLQTVV